MGNFAENLNLGNRFQPPPPPPRLRLLTESLILIGSAMLGATFISNKINSLAFNIISATETCTKMGPMLCQK